MKIVINACYGKFSLSDLGAKRLRELGGTTRDRTDPKLVQVVEELGPSRKDGASGRYALLKVVDIPDGVAWQLEEYDGYEHIAEQHRTWG